MSDSDSPMKDVGDDDDDMDKKMPAQEDNTKNNNSSAEDDSGAESSGSGGSSEESSSEEEGEDSSESEDDGLSEYERLRLQRIARNQARLRTLGFDKPKDEEKKKKKVPTKPKPSYDGPRRELPGRAKRATFNDTAPVRGERRVEEKKNMDICYICQKEDAESLRSCDYCRRLYHSIGCHTTPTIPESNNEEFKCNICVAEGKTRRMACGKCDGCLREDDCMSCTACIAKYERGDKKRSKCVFRKCKFLGKAFTGAADEDQDEGEDIHDTDCFVCQEGGDLICCDGCTKVYHPACHKPKIHDLSALPEEWYCMHCCETKKESMAISKQKNKKYTGTLIADMGHCDLKCTVRFPKIECIVCEEQEETIGKMKSADFTTCKICDDSYHLQCLDPPLEFRPNSWKCPSCKERKIKYQKPEVKASKPLFKGEHDDDCFMCFNGGDLLCCDYCEKAYHLSCHIPPLNAIPTGLWKCQECAALEYTRKMKCGECVACLRDDCGKCRACLDKPKFGGKSRLKQSCEKKRCPFMRFAPPAKVGGSIPKSISKPLKKKEGVKKRKRDSMESEDGIFGDERQKNDEVAGLKSPPELSAAELTAIAKAKEKEETIEKIINSRPLKDDPLGSKMRSIIIRSLKNRDNFKLQEKALENQRLMVTSADNVAKLILLGCLTMVSTAMTVHTDKSIVQAEASALLAELAWLNQSCTVAIVEEGCIQLVLKSLKQHGIDLKVQQMGCNFFRALSYDFANHPIIDRFSGVGAVIDSMKQNADKYDVLKEGSYFLQNILCNPEIKPETIKLIETKGIVATIIDAMTTAAAEESEYTAAAVGMLANLAINEDAREHIGQYESSIPTLLTVLGPDNVDTCKCSLNCLKLLATGHTDLKAKIVKLDGITRLHDFLVLTTDSALADAGLRLLAELTKNDTDNSKILAEGGGFDLIRHAMATYVESPFIQASCCGVLRNLPPGSQLDQANDIVALVLTAMKKHRQDKLVQFEGSQVLIRYSCHFPSIATLVSKKHSFTTTARSSKRKLRSGTTSKTNEDVKAPSDATIQGEPMQQDTPQSKDIDDEQRQHDELSAQVDLILKTTRPLKFDQAGNKIRLIIMKALKNPKDSKTQDKACEVLRFMAKSDTNCDKIVQLGGLTMLTKAVKDHPDKTIVHAEASALLAELSWVNPSCIGKIVEEGCLQLVLKSLEQHGTHLKVQQMGLGFFRALSYDFVNHASIESVNGVVSIINSMKRNLNKYDIMKEGCYFLQNILCNPDITPGTVQILISSGIAPIILETISKKPNDAEYLAASCGVIANIAISDDAREQIMSVDSAVPTLLSVLEADSKEEACKCSLSALTLLCSGEDDTKFKIVSSGGIQAVMGLKPPPPNGVGLALLAELSKDSTKYSQQLYDAGGYDFVIAEMTNNYESAHLQAKACELLSNLRIKNTDQVISAVKLILTAMKNHEHDPATQYTGSQALLAFCQVESATELLTSEEAEMILGSSQFMNVDYGAIS